MNRFRRFVSRLVKGSTVSYCKHRPAQERQKLPLRLSKVLSAKPIGWRSSSVKFHLSTRHWPLLLKRESPLTISELSKRTTV